MKQLTENPNISIQEVADLTGEIREELREQQLEFIRKNVSRNSPLWDIPGYAKPSTK